MLLVVVGLVVLVLVILVVVFLSVRSMRADEDDTGQIPPSQGAAKPARARRGTAGRDRAGAGDAARDYEFAGPSRTRRYARDQDSGRDRREPAARPGRSSRQTATRRDRDWPPAGWDGASDEQYWAELSSDKPLASTARSAQPGPTAKAGSVQPGPAAKGRPAPPPAAADGRGGSAASEDPGTPAFPGSREPARSLAVSDAPDTDPGVRGPADWPGLAHSTGHESWAAEQATGWRAQDPPTSAWNTEPATAGWNGEEEPASPSAWDDHDPLTSPVFSMQAGQAEDDRSYLGSHGRAQARASHSADPADGRADRTTQLSAAVGHDQDAGYGYPASPGWQDTDHDAYADGWAGSGGGYPPAGLEPLPEPAGGWHPAPVAAGHYSQAEPPSPGWDQGGSAYGELPDPGYLPGPRDPGARRRGRHGAERPAWSSQGGQEWAGAQGRDWPQPEPHGWPEPAPDYWQGAGYGANDSYRADDGYRADEGYAQRHAGGYAQRAGHDDPAGYGRETGPDYSSGFGLR